MSFQAMYRVGGVQKSAGTYPDRKLAETAYYEAMPNVRRGIDPSKPEITVYPANAGGQVTLAAYQESWLPKHDVTHNVRKTYE